MPRFIDVGGARINADAIQWAYVSPHADGFKVQMEFQHSFPMTLPFATREEAQAALDLLMPVVALPYVGESEK